MKYIFEVFILIFIIRGLNKFICIEVITSYW